MKIDYSKWDLGLTLGWGLVPVFQCCNCGRHATGTETKGKRDKLRLMEVCSRCRKVTYCSKDCQRDHWKKHKLECNPIGSDTGAVERSEKSLRLMRWILCAFPGCKLFRIVKPTPEDLQNGFFDLSSMIQSDDGNVVDLSTVSRLISRSYPETLPVILFQSVDHCETALASALMILNGALSSAFCPSFPLCTGFPLSEEPDENNRAPIGIGTPNIQIPLTPLHDILDRLKPNEFVFITSTLPALTAPENSQVLAFICRSDWEQGGDFNSLLSSSRVTVPGIPSSVASSRFLVQIVCDTSYQPFWESLRDVQEKRQFGTCVVFLRNLFCNDHAFRRKDLKKTSPAMLLKALSQLKAGKDSPMTMTRLKEFDSNDPVLVEVVKHQASKVVDQDAIIFVIATYLHGQTTKYFYSPHFL